MTFEEALNDAIGEPSQDSLTLIRGMATKAETLARNVAELEATLKAQKEALDAILFGALPEAMDAIGMQKINLTDGTTISIEDLIRGTIPKEPERRAEALGYLDLIGGSDLIKSEVRIPFPKKQHNEAIALADDLRKQGFAVEVGAEVHHMTLGAFVREKLRHGEPVDPNALGITVMRAAKVHLPK
jgi:hypothetical protein